MSSFLSRSLYYKYIAYQNRLVAHGRPTYDGSLQWRKSFHRINNQEEFESAIINWGHYPCVVHMGHSLHFRPETNVTPKRITESALRFLGKIDLSLYPNTADAIEAVYDLTLTVLLQYIGYMLNDKEEHPCGIMSGFDLNRCGAEQTGQVADGVYGWDLIFYDQNKEGGAVYNGNDWYDGQYTPPDEEPPLPPPDTSGDKGYIYYTNEPVKQILWDAGMKLKYGEVPNIEVWYTEMQAGSGLPVYRRNLTPGIVTDAQPPNVTLISIELTAPGPGFIVIS